MQKLMAKMKEIKLRVTGKLGERGGMSPRSQSAMPTLLFHERDVQRSSRQHALS